MPEVPRQNTPVTADQMVPVIAGVYQKLEGQNPSGPSVAILLGQWDLETGGGKATYNWNVGNLKNVNPAKPYFVQPSITTESNQFAAYDSLEGGVSAWMYLLAKASRYASAWAAMKAGDAQGFANALSTSGYVDTSIVPASSVAQRILARIQKYWQSAWNAAQQAPKQVAQAAPQVAAQLAYSPWFWAAVVAVTGGGAYLFFRKPKKTVAVLPAHPAHDPPVLTESESARRFAELRKAGCEPERITMPDGTQVVLRKKGCST